MPMCVCVVSIVKIEANNLYIVTFSFRPTCLHPKFFLNDLYCQFVIISLKIWGFSIQYMAGGKYNLHLVAISQLLSEVMLLKYISIWQWGNGLSCTSGVLAVSRDFVLSGWLPGVKRGHTSQLPHVCIWPAGHEHDSAGSQRSPAHKICITGVLRRMRARIPV